MPTMKPLAAAMVFSILTVPFVGQAADWAKVGQALGTAGTEQPGGIYKIGLPRTDLAVTVDGVPIKPALALGSWLAFEERNGETMVMGDLVLTEDEVSPVMALLAQGGLEITALHNHLLRSSPPTLYLHIAGHGDPVAMAETLHAALALSRTPFGSPSGGAPAPAVGLDTDMLDRTLGYHGRASGGVYQFNVPRAEAITDQGMAVPPAMGTAIAINIQPTGAGQAAVAGDFVLLPGEVNPVLRTLRENGIEVTAVHSHMLTEEPRLFFLHFWANDEAGKLARGLRAALDQVNLAKS